MLSDEGGKRVEDRESEVKKKKKPPRFKVVVNQVCVCACVCVCVCVEIAQICTQDKMLTSGGFG